MPRQTFHHTATTTATQPEVFQRLQDAEVWGEIAGADSTSAETTDAEGFLTGFEFIATVAGSAYRGTATVASNGSNHMATTIDTADLAGVISVDLEPTHNSTAIHVTLDARAKSFIATLAFGAIARSIGNGFGPRIERLGRLLDRDD